jgi:serine/alanine racemase
MKKPAKTTATKQSEFGSLDYFRVIAAFLIVAIHTSPLTSVSETSDFLLTRVIARVAVPFFIMVTGYFVASKFFQKEKVDFSSFHNFVRKTLLLYGVAILIYIPVNLYTGYFNYQLTIGKLIKDVFFNGTFYHLWYLPAVVLGIYIVYLLSKKFSIYTVLIITSCLYLIGLLGDNYYFIVKNNNTLNGIYSLLFQLFDYTRNGIFFAPVFLCLGILVKKKYVEDHEKNIGNSHILRKAVIGFTLSMLLFIVEGLYLHFNFESRHDSMFLFLIPSMYYLFLLLLSIKFTANKSLRPISMVIYIIHPFVIIYVRGFAKVIHRESLFIDNSIIHFLSVSILSFMIAYVCYKIHSLWKGSKIHPDSRAWIEINLDNLRHNIDILTSTLPDKCKLMAVVKANAYGHGDIVVSKELNQIGVKDFAVATVFEGIRLRKNGIKGTILVLGYTNPKDFKFLVKYHLIQTVLDYDYAVSLNNFGNKINVHIKIDTGMHRLGIDYDQVNTLSRIFHLNNLRIQGMFTHLCVSDSLHQDDVLFTNHQIHCFYKSIDTLRTMGYDPGKIHIQSSYGVLNYPELQCDYARIGIAMYGVLSNDVETKLSLDLRPVLSVKARIVLTKSIQKGEAISYGRQYIAGDNMKIAIVSMGYADGIPRSLSFDNGYVIVNGEKAPIVGRICMDQFVIDVTNISDVEQNDIVTIIGQDGNIKMTSEEIAIKSGTITNELLSRLGSRLVRTYSST